MHVSAILRRSPQKTAYALTFNLDIGPPFHRRQPATDNTELMKRQSNTGVLLLLVALHVGSADASAGWIVRGRNRAGSRQAKTPPPHGTVGYVVRPTSTDQIAAARLSESAPPCLVLRGGCGSADGSQGAGVGERGGDVAQEDTSGGETAAADEAEEAAVAGAAGLDEDLYSRQLYVMGKTAMAKMGKADVLISGMRFVCCACRIFVDVRGCRVLHLYP